MPRPGSVKPFVRHTTSGVLDRPHGRNRLWAELQCADEEAFLGLRTEWSAYERRLGVK